jgi:ParB family chromosome partitioning protein
MNPPAMSKEKRKALGRGLGALLPSTPPAKPAGEVQEGTDDTRRSFFLAQIEEVYPGPEQPRHRFEEAALEELAQSIRRHGVIQPLIVRARPEGGYYLIAGERRWRASQRAGLHEVPIVIQDVSSQESFERALVENLQRADLNAIEEALAYQRLADEFSYTQEEIAQSVGKERSTVANSLRLLKLPDTVRAMVEEKKLTMGHARALLSLEDADKIEVCARAVASQGLSVRATETLVRNTLNPPPKKPTPAPKSASVRDVENRLTKALGSKVELAENKKGKGGRIQIQYSNLDDLDRLLEKLLQR